MTTAAVNTPIAGFRTAGIERILVIEHDKALQKVIRRALPSEGYEVELVSSPSIVDRVLFLKMGADDYIAVALSPKELVARLHALRRRTIQSTREASTFLER